MRGKPMPDDIRRDLGLDVPREEEPGRAPSGHPSANPTDLGNALRLAARHGEDLRYAYEWGRWLVWDGTRWKVDDCGAVEARAKETVRSIYAEAAVAEDSTARREIASHARRSEARNRIEAMIALARSEEGIPVLAADLDADPWLLNCENGTLDLRTGQLREHDRADLITKRAPVEHDPEAEAPAWRAFLERIVPDEEVRRFLQRAVGYSLTGDTRERVMLILHGVGRNGKSTFLEAIREVLGNEQGYAMKTPAETLMAKPSGGIPNDVARLKGARFVSASETEFGRRLAESLVKELTGNDTVSARFMRGEWFDFRPTHKTWLGTNHKPEIRGTDPAIWDRIRLVPFEVRIPDEEIDRELPEKLRAELPGILTWAVAGCLAWQRGGLQEPEQVQSATNEYRAGQDVIAAFIDECCVVRAGVWAKFADLYEAYTEWCVESNEKPEKKRAFGDLLSERGFAPAKGGKNVSIRNGIALLTDGDPPGGDGNPGRSEGYPTNGSNSGTTGSNKHPTQDGGETEGNRVTQGVTHDNPQNPSKSQENKQRVTQGYPEIGISESKPSHKDLTGKHGNLGNPEPESGARRQPLVGPAGNGRLTPEEVERHKRLVREGMKPDIARAEVLAKRGEGGVA